MENWRRQDHPNVRQSTSQGPIHHAPDRLIAPAAFPQYCKSRCINSQSCCRIPTVIITLQLATRLSEARPHIITTVERPPQSLNSTGSLPHKTALTANTSATDSTSMSVSPCRVSKHALVQKSRTFSRALRLCTSAIVCGTFRI